MAKNYYPFIILLLCLTTAHGQTKDQLKIVDRFRSAKKDSIFILKYSDKKEFSFKIDIWLGRKLDEVDSMVFHSNVQDVVGPFETDTHYVWIKVVRADSSIKMRAGNIWINFQSIGWDSAYAKAKRIFDLAAQGTLFDNLCDLYAEDSNKKRDCDLGWFWDGTMVKVFSEEIKKRKKGGIFIVKTEYGWHVVKMLDNPRLDKIAVRAMPLYLKK
jgi:peptidyl-prolyl cis-trans isomerase D